MYPKIGSKLRWADFKKRVKEVGFINTLNKNVVVLEK